MGILALVTPRAAVVSHDSSRVAQDDLWRDNGVAVEEYRGVA